MTCQHYLVHRFKKDVSHFFRMVEEKVFVFDSLFPPVMLQTTNTQTSTPFSNDHNLSFIRQLFRYLLCYQTFLLNDLDYTMVPVIA